VYTTVLAGRHTASCSAGTSDTKPLRATAGTTHTGGSSDRPQRPGPMVSASAHTSPMRPVHRTSRAAPSGSGDMSSCTGPPNIVTCCSANTARSRRSMWSETAPPSCGIADVTSERTDSRGSTEDAPAAPPAASCDASADTLTVRPPTAAATAPPPPPPPPPPRPAPAPAPAAAPPPTSARSVCAAATSAATPPSPSDTPKSTDAKALVYASVRGYDSTYMRGSTGWKYSAAMGTDGTLTPWRLHTHTHTHTYTRSRPGTAHGCTLRGTAHSEAARTRTRASSCPFAARRASR
jgi:hypothetical protein